MKNAACKLSICAALVLGSLLPLAAPAQENQGHHQSGIVGQVQGFILFHAWNVTIVSDRGKVVADLLTDPDGRFEVFLKPGDYVLTAYIRDFGPHAIVWGTPVKATVSKKQFTAVTLPIAPPPL